MASSSSSRPSALRWKIAVAGFPAAEWRHAEAAVPDRAGQGHVQQAQIFASRSRLRQLEAGLILAQIQHRRERLEIVVKRLVLFTKPGDKRQPDQGYSSPLTCEGDNLHQVLIAFETHLLAGVAVRLGDMLRQPAHQGMLAFQLAGLPAAVR